MSRDLTPTCEHGHWAMITDGCPLCHPGPCKLRYNLPRHQDFADTPPADLIRFIGYATVFLLVLALLASCATVPGPCSEANEFRADDCPCGSPGVYSCHLPGDDQ